MNAVLSSMVNAESDSMRFVTVCQRLRPNSRAVLADHHFAGQKFHLKRDLVATANLEAVRLKFKIGTAQADNK